MILDFDEYFEFHYKGNDKNAFEKGKWTEGEKNILAFTNMEDLNLFIDFLEQFRERVKENIKEYDKEDVNNNFWTSPSYIWKETEDGKYEVHTNMNVCSGYMMENMEVENEV